MSKQVKSEQLDLIKSISNQQGSHRINIIRSDRGYDDHRKQNYISKLNGFFRETHAIFHCIHKEARYVFTEAIDWLSLMTQVYVFLPNSN